MARLHLSQGSFPMFLCLQQGVLTLEIEDSSTQTVIAEFPLQISLLKGVMSGLSYQIANEFGSLNIVKSEHQITLTAHLASRPKIVSRVSNEKFSSSVEELGS